MLNLSEIEKVIFDNEKISIDLANHNQIKNCYQFLETFSKDKVVYGINTGFGPMAQYRISDADLTQLQYNIIRSHSCGAGEPLADEYVRAAMLSRLQTFRNAQSGVHTDVVDILVAFINNEIYPIIPQHGSVGASGDLVQLAHIALALIGEGEVRFRGQTIPSAEAMTECGIMPLKMYIREGLALTNGTAVMTGIGIVNLIRARRLLEWSTLGSVMINEIASSYDDFMSEELNGLKNHSGQIQIAQKMRSIATGSKMMRSRYEQEPNDEEIFSHKVQPYYSLRCVPQILGPVLETIDNATRIVVEEFNSVDDNPVVDPSTQNIYHGGNFHGDYVSLEMDKLKIAVTKMTMLAERQMNYLFHSRVNEILPPFLNLGVLGLDYGLQAAQFTATSTTAESQTLSNPMYVHSILCNNDNQDIVSMGTNSALLAARVIDNGYQVMAIHVMALAQAVDCLGIVDKLSPQTRNLYHTIRTITPRIVQDKPLAGEIRKVIEYIKEKS